MQKRNYIYYVDLALVKYDIPAFNLCAKKKLWLYLEIEAGRFFGTFVHNGKIG